MLFLLAGSKFAARYLCGYSPPVQQFRNLKMQSDPTSVTFLVSLLFGGLISIQTHIGYKGVVLVITLTSLAVCQVPSATMRIYCASVAILIGISSMFELVGQELILTSIFVPLMSVLVIKGCEWVGSKIDWGD